MNKIETTQYIIDQFEKISFLKVRNQHFSQSSVYDLIFMLEKENKGKSKAICNIYASFLDDGQPLKLRKAIRNLECVVHKSKTFYGVLVAPFFSEQAKEIIKEHNFGYIDLVGNFFISYFPIYLESTGHKNKTIEKRELRSIFSPKGERVIRTLLGKGNCKWEIKDLAKQSEVSLGHTSNIKRKLEDKEYLTIEKPSGFTLTNPSSLLHQWSNEYDSQKHQKFSFFSLESTQEIEENLALLLDEQNIEYAFSGFSAAIRYQAHVLYKKVCLYVEKLPDNLNEIGLKEVESGANCDIFIPYDQGLFSNGKEFNKVKVVSEEQAYLDLLQMKSRGEEAAMEILRGCIETKW
ncbi:MAG: hypothetical protein JKY89_05345 [Immundisolibacteraceae bacterium]|nr:hypothetical protein [Immundisolibacteraceae bacterium]